MAFLFTKISIKTWGVRAGDCGIGVGVSRSRKKSLTTEFTEGTETRGGEKNLGEEGSEDFGAVVEDTADVGGYEEGVDERAAEDGVVDVIGDLGAAVFGDEAVFVAPKAIGA